MSMFRLNDREIREFEADLKHAAAKAIPFATRNTLNSAAFLTQKVGRLNSRQKMIQRNKFTIQSIQVKQTRSLNIRQQESITGSIAPYMEDQEFGAIRTKSGREGVPIPTSYSAGQGENVQPRTRLPRKPNRIENIQLKRRRGRKAKTRKQDILFRVQDAVTSGDRIIFLDLGRRQGMFKVTGGRKGFKRGWPPGAKLRMLYDLSHETVTIPKNPWLKPAQDRVIKRIPAIYRKSLIFQLKRYGLFTG